MNIKQFAFSVSAFSLAVFILFVSILRSASVRYEFNGDVNGNGSSAVLGDSDSEIPYELAYPGGVLPDHPLWSLKAGRDRVWDFITTDPSKDADLALLFADKRVAMSKILFENGDPELGYSTLTKAEKYLESAAEKGEANKKAGIDNSEFLLRLANASLKHRYIIEEILEVAPEDAKPQIVETADYSYRSYKMAQRLLGEYGVSAPENPFNWN